MIATVLTNISFRYELKGIFAFRSGCGRSELAPGILLLLEKRPEAWTDAAYVVLQQTIKHSPIVLPL
jgi:hypothetical protein